MRIIDSALVASLTAAPNAGIAPVYFVWVVARDRTTGAASAMGFWSGDEDTRVGVAIPDGGVAQRDYIGGCNLTVEGLQYVADLTDNAVTVGLSQIADAAQELVRGLDVRLAYCEVHATTMTGGAFTSAPQLMWVGIVDDGPISTPAAGSEGGISLKVRSEIMTQLGAINPAKSSDAHQRRRNGADRFSEYASVIGTRKIQWFKN